MPPRARRALLFRCGVAVVEEDGADTSGRLVREWVVAHQLEDRAVVVQQALDEADEPDVVVRGADAAGRDCNAERDEPDEPVQPQVPRGDLWRAPVDVAG